MTTERLQTTDYVAKLLNRLKLERFFGTLSLQYCDGKVIRIRKEQALLAEDLEREHGGTGSGAHSFNR